MKIARRYEINKQTDNRGGSAGFAPVMNTFICVEDK
jgi:hypothetical protein